MFAKGNAFADARITNATYHIHWRLQILLQKFGTITEALSATHMESNICRIKSNRWPIKLLRRSRAKLTKIVAKNYNAVKNTIKGKCHNLRDFHDSWWTQVLWGEKGLPYHKIEVSHVDFKKWKMVNYGLFMYRLINADFLMILILTEKSLVKT